MSLDLHSVNPAELMVDPHACLPSLSDAKLAASSEVTSLTRKQGWGNETYIPARSPSVAVLHFRFVSIYNPTKQILTWSQHHATWMSSGRAFEWVVHMDAVNFIYATLNGVWGTIRLHKNGDIWEGTDELDHWTVRLDQEQAELLLRRPDTHQKGLLGIGSG